MFQWLIPCIKWPKNGNFWLKSKNMTLFKDERGGFKISPDTVLLWLEWVTIWDIKEVHRSKNAISTTILLKYGPIKIRCLEAIFGCQWWKWVRKKNLRKNPQLWATFVFRSIFKSLVWLGTSHDFHLHGYSPIIISSIFAISQLLVVKMSLGKKSKLKL